MRVSKGTLVRGVGRGEVPVRPYGRGSSNHSGIQDSALEAVDDAPWAARQPSRNDGTIVREGSAYLLRNPRHGKGLQACVSI